MLSQKGFIPLGIIIAIVAILVIGGIAGTYIAEKNVLHRRETPQMPETTNPITSSTESTTTTEATRCFVSGCSREICSENPSVISPCIYKPEFVCYKSAKCESQLNGKCGWTQTAELRACIDKSRGQSNLE